jgi:hypothetical protein
MMTQAPFVDEQVVLTGKVPSIADLKKMLG